LQHLFIVSKGKTSDKKRGNQKMQGVKIKTSDEKKGNPKMQGAQKERPPIKKEATLKETPTSFFTATPLAINCSTIICHSTSSIPVEGEYQLSLKDYLIVSGSSLEAPISTSSKTESAIAFADFRP
jgi:hypothetical protein